MGKPEVGCHKNYAAQGKKQELHGACGEPDAPHAIRGIGQKEEGGHYAWDISPKKYRLSEMNEQMEGERQIFDYGIFWFIRQEVQCLTAPQ